MLLHCFEWLQYCSNIWTLRCAKNRHCASSRVTSPWDLKLLYSFQPLAYQYFYYCQCTMSESPAFLLLYSSVFFSGAKEERSNGSFGWEPCLSIIISWKGPWDSCDCCDATERTYHEDFSMQETWCYCAREWCRSYWGIKNRIVNDADELDKKYMLSFYIKLKKYLQIWSTLKM